MVRLGHYHLTKEELNDYMMIIDENGDNKIQFDEFKKFMSDLLWFFMFFYESYYMKTISKVYNAFNTLKPLLPSKPLNLLNVRITFWNNTRIYKPKFHVFMPKN